MLFCALQRGCHSEPGLSPPPHPPTHTHTSAHAGARTHSHAPRAHTFTVTHTGQRAHPCTHVQIHECVCAHRVGVHRCRAVCSVPASAARVPSSQPRACCGSSRSPRSRGGPPPWPTARTRGESASPPRSLRLVRVERGGDAAVLGPAVTAPRSLADAMLVPVTGSCSPCRWETSP